MSQFNYNDEVGLEYVITKIKSALDYGWVAKDGTKVLSDNNFTTALKNKLDGIAEGATKIILDTVLSSTSTNGITNKAVFDEFSKVAYLAGATFTGTLKAPTATQGTQDTTVATTAFVSSAISAALSQITGIKFEGGYTSYQDLIIKKPTGESGVIYLVNNSGSSPNTKDEYFWDGTKYELFGTTAIDLSNYVQTTDLVAITTTEIDQMFEDAGFVFPTSS